MFTMILRINNTRFKSKTRQINNILKASIKITETVKRNDLIVHTIYRAKKKQNKWLPFN